MSLWVRPSSSRILAYICKVPSISSLIKDSSTSMLWSWVVKVVWRQWSLQYVSRMRSSVSFGSRPSSRKYFTTSARSSAFIASPYCLQKAANFAEPSAAAGPPFAEPSAPAAAGCPSFAETRGYAPSGHPAAALHAAASFGSGRLRKPSRTGTGRTGACSVSVRRDRSFSRHSTALII